MSFNGNEGSFISLSDASVETKNYRNANPGAVKAFYVGKNKLNEILGQTGCVGVRIYNSVQSDGTRQVVIVGVDANENDLENGLLLNHSIICPPVCGNANKLNS